jgi:hypothetical protein
MQVYHPSKTLLRRDGSTKQVLQLVVFQLLVATGLLAFHTATGSAQDVREAGTLRKIRAVRIRSLPDSSAHDNFGLLYFADSRDRFYQYRFTDQRFIVFDARGGIATFGRVGRGPGEYSRPITAATAGPGDTIHIFQWGGVHTVLAPKTFEFVRRDEAWRVQNVAPMPLGSDRWVAIYPDTTAPQSRGDHGALALLDGHGRPVRVFGAPSSGQPATPSDRRLAICGASGGKFWALHYARYQAEEWDTSGVRHRVLTRPGPGGVLSNPSPLGPRIWACQVNDRKYLWILAVVPRPNQKAPIGRGQGPGGPRLMDAVVEVINLEHNLLVASQRFDTMFPGFIGPNRLYSTSDEDEPTIDIWELRLDPPLGK